MAGIRLFIRTIVAISAVAAFAAADNGESPVLRGLRESLTHIKCGEYYYTAEVISEELEAEEKTEWMDQVVSVLVEAADDAEDLEQMRKELKGKAPGHLAAAAHRKMEFYVASQGASAGSDVYVQMSLFDQSGNSLSPRVTFLSRNGVDPSQSIYEQDGHAKCRYPVYMGHVDVSRVGRVQGALARALLADGNRIVEFHHMELSDGLIEVSCEFENLGGETRLGRLVCDPARNFVVLEQEERDAEGTLVEEWRSSDYFFQNSVWFPGSAQIRSYKSRQHIIKNPKTTYSFSPDQTKLNQQPPLSRFAAEVPAGRYFHDHRSNPATAYLVSRDVDLTLDMLDDLAGVPGFRHVEAGQLPTPELETIEARGFSPFVVVNISILVLVVVLWILRTRSLLLLCPFVCLMPSGCSSQVETLIEATETQPFAVSPEEIRLGKISAEGGKCEFNFRLKSVVESSTHVSILPSCNCTTSGQEFVSLQPKAEQVVSMAFDPRGKQGVVDATIRLQWEDSNRNVRYFSVPIRAEVERSWSARPSRVFMGGDSGASGSVAIRGRGDAWENAIVKTQEGLTVELTSIKQDGAHEIRHFRIVSVDTASPGALFVMLEGQRFPCLTIPVVF